MNIAYFSPLSPVRSGISDYSQELLPLLGPRVGRVDLFVDEGCRPESRAIIGHFDWHPAARFEELDRDVGYDLAVYQQGNNPHHEYIYRRAMETPGLLVLHDFVLHHLITEMTLARGDEQGYLDAMLASHGPIGHRIAGQRIRGLWSDLQHFLYPACWQLLRASRAVMVHSPYLERLLRGNLPAGIPVRRVPMGIEIPSEASGTERRADARRQLDLPRDALVLGSFGFVTPMKQLDLALRAVRQCREQGAGDIRFVVVGEISDACPLEALAAELGLSDAVRFTGYLEADEFQHHLHAVDLALNLRYPTAGETSASLLRVMGMGVPVVVPRYRQYADIPPETCARLELGPGEEERLAGIIGELAADTPRREAMGRAARDFVAREHTLEAAAAACAEYIEDLVQGRAGEGAEARKQTAAWIGLAGRMPAGSGPHAGDGYRRNSRVPCRLEAAVSVRHRPSGGSAGDALGVPLEITNRGDTVWLAEPNHHGGYVIVAARIFGEDGSIAGPEQEWQRLPRDLAPGESVALEVHCRYPARPGRYAVRFDLLDAGIGWFSAGLPPDRLPGFDITVG